mmetsp:Transcript_62974/g.150672  ORF Transcript_62974/g.150672 Transcript_62974/m.150672 type:complete len:104 (-) Transcript_62974:1482-1793(-)
MPGAEGSVRAISSLCVPVSTSCPPWRTTMVSARATVLRRCAITSVVRSFIRRSRASCTAASLSESSADVASSSSSTRGSRRTARAMATLCFCPPDSWLPCSPT